MKIPIEEIPDEGIEVRFSREEELLTEPLALIPPPPGTDVDPHVTGYVRITNTGQDIFLTGSAVARMTLTCSRCLAGFHTETNLDLALVIRRRQGEDDATDDEFESQEADVFYVDGDELDPGEVVLQELFLEHPINPLCSEDCPGLCPQCGRLRGSEECTCDEEAPTDPRWKALAELKDRLGK